LDTFVTARDKQTASVLIEKFKIVASGGCVESDLVSATATPTLLTWI